MHTGALFEGYFSGRPPFGAGRKKNEFPDALALSALEKSAESRGMGILVVSKDNDWRDFCKSSKRLYLVTDIETALALIAGAPQVLRSAVLNWMEYESDKCNKLVSHLAKNVEFVEFSADAIPSFGQCELYVWAAELKKVTWPNEEDIDIIELELQANARKHTLVVSLPASLMVRVPVDISFSVWDGIDKEVIPMGGRTMEVDEEIEVQVTVTFEVYNHGSEDEKLEFVDAEIEPREFDLDLGEIDVLQPEDYRPIDDESVDD